tara:strand:- start:1775 stop:2026 length:252 start_codon:yes stop_codon:yes gene_type:complete
MTKYPEELTLDEFDDLFVGQQFASDYHQEDTIVIEDSKERIEAVKLFAKQINGVIYSQVDLESGERGYHKGIDSWIGIYEVVK